jgi:hypothetical protein
MLLELVLDAWGAPCQEILEIKYLAPVLPDETVLVQFSPLDDGERYRFVCRVDGRAVCSGLLLADGNGA